MYGPSLPPIDPAYVQARRDQDQLDLLAIFHYVVGGLTIVVSSAFLIHFFVGLVLATNPGALGATGNGQQPPHFVGYLFMVVGGLFVLLGWTIGGLAVYAGRCLAARRRHVFVFVAAVLECVSVPIGMALGICTILVLNRPSVKALFDGGTLVYGPGWGPPAQ